MAKSVRWIKRTHLFRKDEYECSACGFRTEKPSSACPGCGKLARGTKYDPAWIDEMEDFDAISGE